MSPSSILSSAISSVLVATTNLAFVNVSLAEASDNPETSGMTTSPRPPEAKKILVPIPSKAKITSRMIHHFFRFFVFTSGRASSSGTESCSSVFSFGSGMDLNDSGIGVSSVNGVSIFVSLSMTCGCHFGSFARAGDNAVARSSDISSAVL